MTKQEYRQEAADCVRMAEQTSDPTTKLVSVGLAQAWLQLAQLADTTGDASESAETGEISEAPARSAKSLDFAPSRVV